MTKKETFKWVVQIIASIATAILTALSATSCAGYGPIALWSKRWNSQQKKWFLRQLWQGLPFLPHFSFSAVRPWWTPPCGANKRVKSRMKFELFRARADSGEAQSDKTSSGRRKQEN